MINALMSAIRSLPRLRDSEDIYPSVIETVVVVVAVK